MAITNLTKAECEELLGLSGDYTAEDINRAYREQVKEFHPDKAVNAPEGIRRLAAEQFNKITKAQRLLKDALVGRPHFADATSNVVNTQGNTDIMGSPEIDSTSATPTGDSHMEEEFYNTWSGCEELFADMSPQEIQYVLERLQTAPEGVPYVDVVKQAHAEWTRMNEPSSGTVGGIFKKIQSLFNSNAKETTDTDDSDWDSYEQYYKWNGGPGGRYYGYQHQQSQESKPKKKTSKLKVGCCIVLAFLSLSVLGIGSCVASLFSGDGGTSEEPSTGDAGFSYTDITLDQVSYESGNNSVCVSAQITNNNDTYLLNKATITVAIYDSDGDRLLKDEIISDALLPGQTGFVTETFTVSLLDGLGNVEVYIEEGDTNWIIDGRDWLMSEFTVTGSVSEHEATSWADSNTHELEVTITNPGGNDTFEDGIHVYAGLFDDNGNLITVLETTYATAIESGETINTTLLAYTSVEDIKFDSVGFYAAPVITSERLLLGG